MSAQQSTSTRPYLVRAMYEWCTDNGFTPYVAVLVDDSVQVPREYVRDGEIVLNISLDATQALKLGNDFIEFTARFSGVARSIVVPMDRVVAIYARENGQGMTFPQQVPSGAASPTATGGDRPDASPGPSGPPTNGSVHLSAVPTETASSATTDEPPRPPPGSRPSLKRIK